MTGLADRLVAAAPAPLRAAWRRLKTIPAVRDAGFDARDALDWTLRRRHPLSPPRRLLHGIGSSPEVGETFLRHFRELADLRPDERVLDVGCGVGRMAVPLAGYLRPAGTKGSTSCGRT